MNYANPRTAQFRATLDRLPDEIALAIGLHIYDDDTLGAPETCVCGWIIREAIARQVNTDADNTEFPRGHDGGGVLSYQIAQRCVAHFGGGSEEWRSIYWGVTGVHAPLIEEALFDRVMAAATAPPKKRSGSLPHKRGRGQ